MPRYPQEKSAAYRELEEVHCWLLDHFEHELVWGFIGWLIATYEVDFQGVIVTVRVGGDPPAGVAWGVWEFVGRHFGPEFNVRT